MVEILKTWVCGICCRNWNLGIYFIKYYLEKEDEKNENYNTSS
jgi:hypothetical protein